jgi:uncharacterized protein YjdB
LAAVLLPACDAATLEPLVETEAPREILLSASALDMMDGDTLRLRATLIGMSGQPIASPSAGQVRGGTRIVWSSSNPEIAAIDAAGLVRARTSGTAVLTATAGQLSSRANARVGGPKRQTASKVIVSPEEETITSLGSSVQFTAIVLDDQDNPIVDPSLTWSTQNPEIAAVDGSGKVTSRALGAALIVAVSGNAADTSTVRVRQEVATVSVSPARATLAVGDSVRLTATAVDANGVVVEGVGFTWTSSDAPVAAVSTRGTVIGVEQGTSTVTAAADGKTGTATITVDAGSAPPPPSSPPPPGGSVSVLDFGAVGDGTTDNTAAFRNAIESAGQQRLPLFVPAGRYLIGSSLTLNHSIEIFGEGHERSVITSNHGATRLLVRESGTAFRDLGFEAMVEPIALVSREGYLLENVRFERCRFEDMFVGTRNRGVIGLSSGNSSQRPHRIHNLIVRDCVFRDIDAHAINIRANISSAQILGNQFLDIVNSRGEGVAPSGGYAIRLGESSDDSGQREIFAPMTHHRIEGNLIRGMRKGTVGGNLIGLLLYGNYHLVQSNVFEDIDGTAEGIDVDAMYIRGAHNRILHNTIRNVRGADDDGALAFKGGLDLGSVNNVIAHNTIEDIHGMSAIEVSTTHLHLHDNVIRNAPRRGYYQRGGEGLLMENNTWINANVTTRSPTGTTTIVSNRFMEATITLSTGGSTPSNREAVHIRGNLFERREAGRTIGLANGVEEWLISVVDNTFRTPSSGGHTVDFIANGTVHSVEWRNNTTEGPFSYRGP